MSRLPTPGGDDGTWGTVLNDFLAQAHNVDGTLKANAVGAAQVQDGSLPAAKLTTAAQTNLAKSSTAVQSVNTKLPDGTGAVTLTATDVGADAAGAAAAAQTASLQKSANLSDVANATTSLVNLGADARYILQSSLRSQQIAAGVTQRALKRFHYALGARNSEPCDVFFCAGDSLPQGAQNTTLANTYPQKFLATLRQRFPQTAAGGAGLLNAFGQGGAVNPFPDNPVSGTTSGYLYPYNNVPGYSLDSTSTWLLSAGTFTYSFTGTGIDIDLFTTAGSAGVGTIKVDGTTYGSYNGGTGILSAGAGNWTISNSGTNTPVHAKVRSLVSGPHTLTITWVSGVFYFGSAFAYNGDETNGIRLATSAWSGNSTAQFYGSLDGVTTQSWLDNIGTYYFPDLVIIDNGANNYAGSSHMITSPATHLAHLQGIIATIKTNIAARTDGGPVYVPSFVLTPPHAVVTSNIGGVSPSGGTMVANWQSYVDNYYTVAANDPDGAVCVWDIGQRLQGTSNTWDNSTYQGILSANDRVHFSDGGSDWVANGLVEFVSPT